MSMGQESTDFEWLDPVLSTTLDNGAAESSLFLKEGYLHLMEELPPKKENGPAATLSYQATNLVGRMSDPAIQGSWNRRWCVLSQTPRGFYLLLYKDRRSYYGLQSPCGILELNNCLKLSSLPTHAKSENAFSITFDQRDFIFYTDKSSEQDDWMQMLQDSLNLLDASCNSPLKGLPRQKALRKDSQGTHDQEGHPATQEDSTASKSAFGIDKEKIGTGAAVIKGILATSEVADPPKEHGRITITRNMSFKTLQPVTTVKFKKLST